MPTSSDDDALARFDAVIGSADLDTLRALAASVLAGTEVPPDRRRPPPPDLRLLTVRVDLLDTGVWRRLEIRGDLPLDLVHEVLQEAMGWTDSHLHQFVLGDGFGDPAAQRLLTEEDVEEGEIGVLEREVRLDELLQDPGDRLVYTYDFGDGWDHELHLEAVAPLPDDAPPARCTDGRLACPPEDCGGPGGYAELVAMARALADGLPVEDGERWEWAFPGMTGEEVLARLESFDAADVDLAGHGIGASPELLGPVADLARRLPRRADRAALLEMVVEADLGRPVLLDADLAAAHVHAFRWFLGHVGDGLTLTSARYLRPADVEAVVAELDLGAEWIGTMNRESHTRPVLDLRQNLQRLGLLRVARGRLLPTRVGEALAGDPVGLWWHVVGRLPLEKDEFGHDVGVLDLLAHASGQPHTAEKLAVVRALGWAHRDGRALGAHDLIHAAGDTRAILARMGVLPARRRDDGTAARPGLELVARAALRGGR